MKIGIIDGGVDELYVFANRVKIIKYAEISVNYTDSDNILKFVEYDKDDIAKWYLYPCQKRIFNDDDKHGTMILNIIYQFYNRSKFIICKILNEENKSYDICFIKALEWMINEKPKIINLSLGMFNEKFKDQIYSLTKQAVKEDIIICCAASSIKSYPAVFDTVFTISNEKLFIENNNFDKQIKENIDITLTDNLFDGKKIPDTSQACAIFTGILSRNYNN